MPKRLLLAVLAGLPAGCASLFPGEEAVPNRPTPPERGVVYLFNGLTFPFEHVSGTGTHALAQNIRRAGVRAEIDRPSGWQAAAEGFLGQSPPQPRPVAVYGYSYGAKAALRFAERLGQAGIPIQTLVVLEAVRPIPVPCNVREAIHLSVADILPVPVTALVPERAGCTRIREIRFAPQGPAPLWLNHWNVSRLGELHAAVQEELLDGGRVRLRMGATADRAARTQPVP
jgi:pimeloyl-ACP methyl ester carboxylesterase